MAEPKPSPTPARFPRFSAFSKNELLKGYRFLRSERAMNVQLPVAISRYEPDGEFSLRIFNFITPQMHIWGDEFVSPYVGPRRLVPGEVGSDNVVLNAITESYAIRIRIKSLILETVFDGYRYGTAYPIDDIMHRYARLCVAGLDGQQLSISSGQPFHLTTEPNDLSGLGDLPLVGIEDEWASSKLNLHPAAASAIWNTAKDAGQVTEFGGINDLAILYHTLTEGASLADHQVLSCVAVAPEAIIEYYAITGELDEGLWMPPAATDAHAPGAWETLAPQHSGPNVFAAQSDMKGFIKAIAWGPSELGDIFLTTLPPQIAYSDGAGAFPDRTGRALILTVMPNTKLRLNYLNSPLKLKLWHGANWPITDSGMDPLEDETYDSTSQGSSVPIGIGYTSKQFGVSLVGSVATASIMGPSEGIVQVGSDRFIAVRAGSIPLANGSSLLAHGQVFGTHNISIAERGTILFRVLGFTLIKPPARFAFQDESVDPWALSADCLYDIRPFH